MLSIIALLNSRFKFSIFLATIPKDILINLSTLFFNFIILNTTLTEDLINEGIVRELVSKVQNLRKVKDFDVADRITLYYDGDIESIISEFTDYIKKETLSVDIVKKEDLSENFNLNGIDVKLDVEKVTQ